MLLEHSIRRVVPVPLHLFYFFAVLSTFFFVHAFAVILFIVLTNIRLPPILSIRMCVLFLLVFFFLFAFFDLSYDGARHSSDA
jgi:hypothetical protein